MNLWLCFIWWKIRREKDLIFCQYSINTCGFTNTERHSRYGCLNFFHGHVMLYLDEEAIMGNSWLYLPLITIFCLARLCRTVMSVSAILCIDFWDIHYFFFLLIDGSRNAWFPRFQLLDQPALSLVLHSSSFCDQSLSLDIIIVIDMIITIVIIVNIMVIIIIILITLMIVKYII